MKKVSISKVIILLPTLFLTACGYGLKEIYKGVPYASYNFDENYYNVWDKEINYNSKSVTEKRDVRTLEDSKDFVFTRLENEDYEESYANFKLCESNWSKYAYTYDIEEPEEATKQAYGPAVALGKIDKSFKYGVVSKLFDGQMFCNGHFQNSRTQVGSSNVGNFNGFSVKFAKECTYAEYFMMNFKCSVITTEDQNLGPYLTDLTLNLGFYLKNSNGYTYVPVTYDLVDVPTNSGDDHFLPPFSGRLNSYVCFGFKLHAFEDDGLLDLTRLSGISFEYKINKVHKKSGEVFDTTPENVRHAIMLYEMSLPHSTWH